VAEIFPTDASTESSAARLDKWLWAVRIFKTRPLATAACRGGAVEISGNVAKPARSVHPGEIVVVQQELITRTLKVVAVPRTRIGAKRVTDFLVDLTPASEFERQRERGRQQVVARAKGLGRPTKRERRTIDRLFN
jgi:ribosome-associated heat shock protein Hsp15